MDKNSRDVRIRVADPAGNITIFVLDRFERCDYAKVAVQLLDMEEIGAEQVAFVTGCDSMEMCGLEFCGNASRAFGLICAEKVAGQHVTVPVHVSGAEGVTLIETDIESGYACIEMPEYKEIYPLSKILSMSDLSAAASAPTMISVPTAASDSAEPSGSSSGSPTTSNSLITIPDGMIVDQGGIVHVVLEDTEASDELFYAIRDLINEKIGPPAMGVMFCKGDHVTPVVYVRDVDSVYHEGSCCSGTTAVVTARSAGRPDGVYEYTIVQPAGSLNGTVRVESGRICSVRIGGTVRLQPERTVRIKI